ncbi:hypothetical protein TcasGA2_TC008893 [Tribolium castaneum]|uniref:Uncharacterized protein n=1 Tax=Tribolium castaneum TaxID=7070 RepID=D6WQL8_TRICA|nr:hypothetical protein TcasGA2_TC008893 [Tribolium castaneum]
MLLDGKLSTTATSLFALRQLVTGALNRESSRIALRFSGGMRKVFRIGCEFFARHSQLYPTENGKSIIERCKTKPPHTYQLHCLLLVSDQQIIVRASAGLTNYKLNSHGESTSIRFKGYLPNLTAR